MKRLISIIYLALITLVVNGCSSSGPTRNDAADVIDKGDAASSVAKPYDSSAIQPLSDPAATSLDSGKIIYFDFDSYNVDEAGRELIAAHANYLTTNPAARIRLEGHGDERGSREYNIGLGERRGQAVKRILELLNASPEQISIVSFGEEKPVDYGHNQDAWRQNRRVEIVYVDG
ncbi:MAG: peptidoglycan-associated lipoprotein Pal [Gammaproteobacteria bacterium]